MHAWMHKYYFFFLPRLCFEYFFWVYKNEEMKYCVQDVDTHTTCA